MAFKHGQDRAHKGHFSEPLRNAIGDEISWLKSLWIEIEFERAFLTRLTYAFQDALRLLVSNALTHFTTALRRFHTASARYDRSRNRPLCGTLAYPNALE